MTPRVCVLMPVWNAGPFLAPAIESILAQEEVDFALLIVDDGSTDGSGELLSQLARRDARIRLVHRGANEGIAAARNRLLAAARESASPFIAFLNHDDLARPDRLRRQIAFLEENPRVGLLSGCHDCIDDQGRLLPEAKMPGRDLEIRWRGLVECPLRLSVLTLRASLLGAMEQPRFDPAYAVYSDYDFVSRALHAAARHGLAVAALPDTLGSYRRHAGSVSVRRHDLMVANGALIATSAVARELPGHPLGLEEMTNLRTVFPGAKPADWRATLAGHQRAVETYLDLLAAFRAKHHGHPDLAHIE